MKNRICVITFTVDRVPQLIRAIKSVMNQDIEKSIRHLIFTENFQTLKEDRRLLEYQDHIEIVPIAGEPYMDDSSPRMARLRNEALSFVAEEYVTFLDDDNEMEPPHLKSLFSLISERKEIAAYSWRRLLYPDGSEFDGKSYPWHGNQSEANKRWKWCVKAAVLEPGNAVMRDGPVNIPDPMSLATIDMNEWLFKTKELKAIGMDFTFSQADIQNRVGEDDKLFSRVMKSGLPILGSERATIKYYLGGVSNYRNN